MTLCNHIQYSPYDIDVHLLFDLWPLVPRTTIVEHRLRLMSSVDHDPLGVVRILQRNAQSVNRMQSTNPINLFSFILIERYTYVPSVGFPSAEDFRWKPVPVHPRGVSQLHETGRFSSTGHPPRHGWWTCWPRKCAASRRSLVSPAIIVKHIIPPFYYSPRAS